MNQLMSKKCDECEGTGKVPNFKGDGMNDCIKCGGDGVDLDSETEE